jgi:hypothetical protein
VYRSVADRWPRLGRYLAPFRRLGAASGYGLELLLEALASAPVLPRRVLDVLDEQLAQGRRTTFGRRRRLLSWHREPDGRWQARLSGPELERTIERSARTRIWAIRRSARAMDRTPSLRDQIETRRALDLDFDPGDDEDP